MKGQHAMPGRDGFLTLTPGASGDGWQIGFATWAQIRESMGPPLPPEPPTTADMARAGKVVGAAIDRLRVAAFLRCRTEREKLGAILHLDRSARDLPALWLAELLQVEIGRGISKETWSGRTTDGSRVGDLDAVVIPSGRVPLATRVYLSCVNAGHDVHCTTVATLIREGRAGLSRRGPEDMPRRAIRLDCLHQVS